MKKTLATLLVLAMVASLCCMMFVSADESNLLAGKEYEISEQFRAGGADVGWGYSETAPISYPDNGFELTDGYVPTNEDAYDAACWMGFNQQTPAQKERGYAYVNFDLGEVCSLSEFSFTALKDLPTGIQPAYDVEYFVSLDGEEYFSAGKNYLDTDALAALEDKAVHTFKTEVNVSARYIQIRFISYGWNFLGEIEAIGVVGGNAPAPGAGEEPAPEPEMFWLTHYADGTVEGSGVIYTETDTAGGWWIHVAFAPIAGVENAYEIVEITNGLSDGKAAQVAVPEGGFVWAANYGNDYISLGMGDTDFTSPNCSDAIERATAWVVGDQFVFAGVDFETIPTSTPDVMWYDDAYVCTSTITKYVPGSAPETVTETINVDGILDDTGWVKADFAVADNTNGRWQENYEAAGVDAPDVKMEYAYRTDADNVYFAVKTNFAANAASAMGEDTGADFDGRCESGTRFRLWLDNTPAEGDARSALIDIMYEQSGDDVITGCYLTKVRTTEYTAVITTNGESTYMEACFPKAFFAIEDGFKMAVTYSDVIFGVNADGDAFHNYIYEDNSGAPWSTSAAWPVYNCADLVLGTYTVEGEGGEDDNDNAVAELEEALKELVGEAVEDPAYGWALEVTVDETGKVTVVATLSNVDAAQLQCIEGTLHYDATVLTLLTGAGSENELLCLTEPAGSAGKWENMSTLVEDGNIRLGAATFDTSVVLTDADPMVFTLEFQLAEGETLTGMYIDTPESYGMNVDGDTVHGNGAYGILEVETEEEPSTPSTPEEDSSDDVPAGDAGILVFAVLGILAIAGAAVVIKVRN